jgi:hypothetical protein
MSIQSPEKFIFYTRLHLTELTGLKAASIDEMLKILDYIPGSSIYHHTHRYLQQHQYLSPEPPNDFAYWVNSSLNEDELAEKLSSINTIEYGSINELRKAIASTILAFATAHPERASRRVNPGYEFYFLKSVSFILPTDYTADTAAGIADNLEKVAADSIYFHLFESRLRLEKKTNDISLWIEKNTGNIKLAAEIQKLDPYAYTIEELRSTIVKAIRRSGV